MRFLIVNVVEANPTAIVVTINAQIHAHCSDSLALVQLLLHHLITNLVLGRCPEHRFGLGHGGRVGEKLFLVWLEAHATAASLVPAPPSQWRRRQWRRRKGDTALMRFSRHGWLSSIEDGWSCRFAVHEAQRAASHNCLPFAREG